MGTGNRPAWERTPHKSMWATTTDSIRIAGSSASSQYLLSRCVWDRVRMKVKLPSVVLMGGVRVCALVKSSSFVFTSFNLCCLFNSPTIAAECAISWLSHYTTVDKQSSFGCFPFADKIKRLFLFFSFLPYRLELWRIDARLFTHVTTIDRRRISSGRKCNKNHIISSTPLDMNFGFETMKRICDSFEECRWQ